MMNACGPDLQRRLEGGSTAGCLEGGATGGRLPGESAQESPPSARAISRKFGVPQPVG